MQTFKQNDIVIETFPIGTLSCNCVLIYHDKTREAIIVDPGDQLNEILGHITKRSLKVKNIIHTHAHFDHIACSHDLKVKVSSPTALHHHDRKLYLSLSYQGQLFGFDLPDPSEADIYFKEGDSFLALENNFGLFKKAEEEINGNNIKIIHTPGHSPGSTSFYIDFFEPHILISGDTLFKDSIGRTDLLGGDFPSIISSIKNKLMILPSDTIVIPGHGELTTIEHEKMFNPFLK